MLIVRTNHDIITHYVYEWCEPLISLANRKGFTVYEIKPNEISLKNFESRVKKICPSFIFFNGHGNKNAFYDNKSKEFLNISSASLFRDTITFARACDSLVELGAATVKKGCKCFVGYRRKFWIPRIHEFETRPLKDPLAKQVLEASNLVASELLNGKTVQESIYKSNEYSAKAILDLLYSNDPYRSATLPALVANDSALGFEGDEQSKL